MIITDPRAIPTSDGPMIVSKGGGLDLESRLIRWRTGSWCEHSMIFLNQGQCIWEGPPYFYGPGKMEGYMVPNVCLKFYQLGDMNPAALKILQDYVNARIAAPWWAKAYDWIGIFGEAIGFPKIHTPGLEYCSVDAIHALEAMAPALGGDSQNMISLIPAEENPGFLDNFMAQHPSIVKLYGVYQYGAPAVSPM